MAMRERRPAISVSSSIWARAELSVASDWSPRELRIDPLHPGTWRRFASVATSRPRYVERAMLRRSASSLNASQVSWSTATRGDGYGLGTAPARSSPLSIARRIVRSQQRSPAATHPHRRLGNRQVLDREARLLGSGRRELEAQLFGVRHVVVLMTTYVAREAIHPRPNAPRNDLR